MVHTMKEEVMVVIEKLPDTVDIDAIIKELEDLKHAKEDADVTERTPIYSETRDAFVLRAFC